MIGILLIAGILFAIIPLSKSSAAVTANDVSLENADSNSVHDQVLSAAAAKDPSKIKRRMTPEERRAAGKRLKKSVATGTMVAATTVPGSVPDYFGLYPNFANSPLPVSGAAVSFTGGGGANAAATAAVVNGVVTGITLINGGSGYTSAPSVSFTGVGMNAAATASITTDVVSAVTLTNGGSGYVTGGIHKFVDPLPGLAIAVPDTCTFSGQIADCYNIELREYTQKMHTDLPPTKLRGYIQVKNGVDVAPISYLGPVIVAQRDRPVRINFSNKLPTGLNGNLFIPVDTTYMGAGTGPNASMGTNCSVTPKPSTCYSENRATLHLHGGATPWISDGTPHQWITPEGEGTSYPKGVSVQNVPDMPDPGPGNMTFFYTNEQSARLMFYHDHAYGITRLNVYAGEAAGYLLTDPTEQSLIGTGGALDGLGLGIPLVIQDRTFVPDNTTSFTNQLGTFSSQLMAQDPTWDSAKWGGYGQLWFPHVYMPNQNPGDVSGANAMGRWDYGPWFWPPFTGLVYGPIPNPYYDPNCVSSATQYCEGPMIPGTPDARLVSPSGVPEAFMDTPIVNGMAYPVLNVTAGPVRLRILNAANDRFLNLQLYKASNIINLTSPVNL